MQIYNREYKVTGFTQKLVRCCDKIVSSDDTLLMSNPPKKVYRCDTCGAVKTLGYEETSGEYHMELVSETLDEKDASR